MRMITTPPLAPAISVAMPMYNFEKYIGACLESLLGQTFQNFEVVVVDDGSTDNSPAILESYIPKFGGRLKTSRIEKNSGSPSPAYNKAVALSRGKYVYIMDSDDLIVNNALEILYNYAEKFNVDVVHMDKYWNFIPNNDNIFPTQQEVKLNNPSNAVEKPTLISDNQLERLKKGCLRFYGSPPWQRLVKRDFLIEKNITFPNLKASSDLGHSIEVIYHAEKLLRIPNPLYVYRVLPNSASHKKESLNYWIEMLIDGINYFENWMNQQSFFRDNPQCQWLIFDAIARDAINHMAGDIFSISNEEFYRIANSKLKKIFGDNASVTSYCFVSSVFSKLQCSLLQQNLNKLSNDIKILQANQNQGG